MLVTADRDLVLPFTYVENMVDAIWRVGTREAAVGEVFNVIDDGAVTFGEYLDRFRATVPDAPRALRLPRVLPYAATVAYEAAAGLGLVRKGVTSRAQLRWKQAPVRFSGEKLARVLGWEPPVPLDRGVERTFRWYARAG